jgi:hypothetical protein
MQCDRSLTGKRTMSISYIATIYINNTTTALVLLFIKPSFLHYIPKYLLPNMHYWCWRRMDKISWTDYVRNEEVLLRVKGRGISYMKYVNGRRTGFVTFCVETVFYNGLLKERYKVG